VLVFKKAEEPRAIAPGAPIELAVACTGEPSSTRAMVEQVARQLARRPQVVERTFDGIDTLARKGVAAIEGARWYEVGHLMDLNHALLASLMVSTEALERACNVARQAGALGAKLTGGGGGGCAIALAPGNSAAVLAAWAREGIDGFAVTIAAGTPPKDDAFPLMGDAGGLR
jgi:mevalonate kinase